MGRRKQHCPRRAADEGSEGPSNPEDGPQYDEDGTSEGEEDGIKLESQDEEAVNLEMSGEKSCDSDSTELHTDDNSDKQKKKTDSNSLSQFPDSLGLMNLPSFPVPNSWFCQTAASNQDNKDQMARIMQFQRLALQAQVQQAAAAAAASANSNMRNFTRDERPLDLSGSNGGSSNTQDDNKDGISHVNSPKAVEGFPLSWPFGSGVTDNPLVSKSAVLNSTEYRTSLSSRGMGLSSQTNTTANLPKIFNPSSIQNNSSNISPPISIGTTRPSAWQSQWMTRPPGIDHTHDVFRCVWCHESYSSLAALTQHLKEAKHSSAQPSLGLNNLEAISQNTKLNLQRAPTTGGAPNTTPKKDSTKDSSSTIPIPRKLVRGQDVWLGKGQEQTRQILKCMWCGQSFKSLADLTIHMQETQHYTKVISQEQITSWKASTSDSLATVGPQAPSHLTAILTCKVCDKAFPTLKELSDHMIKDNHIKSNEANLEQVKLNVKSSSSTSLSSSAVIDASSHLSRRQQPMSSTNNSVRTQKEKRKKSLPVRKLLEMERANVETDFVNCDKCGKNILNKDDTNQRKLCGDCLVLNPSQSTSPTSVKEFKSENFAPSSPSKNSSLRNSPSTTSPLHTTHISNVQSTQLSKKSPPSPKSGTSSILGSLEKMIETSFGSKSKKRASNGTGILQRLGIDDGVELTRPSPNQAAYLQHQQQQQQQILLQARIAAAAAAVSGMFTGHDTNSIAAAAAAAAGFAHSYPEYMRPTAPQLPSSLLSPIGLGGVSPPLSTSVLQPPVIEETPKVFETVDSDIELEESHSNASSPPKRPHVLTVTSSCESTPLLNPQQIKVTSSSPLGSGGSSGNSGGHPLEALRFMCSTKKQSLRSPTSAVLEASNITAGVHKCALCDSCCSSRESLRLHLSQIHLVKEENLEFYNSVASSSPSSSTNSNDLGLLKRKLSPSSSSRSPPTVVGVKEETSETKFLKYSELARQLSGR